MSPRTNQDLLMEIQIDYGLEYERSHSLPCTGTVQEPAGGDARRYAQDGAGPEWSASYWA